MLTTETGTQTRILAAAKTEFLEKGFRNASLRTIVKLAGVTTGAFYGYYSNKEALFSALVEPHAAAIMGKFMQAQDHFAQLPDEDQIQQMGMESGACFDWMIDYLYSDQTHYDAVKLIICCAVWNALSGFHSSDGRGGSGCNLSVLENPSSPWKSRSPIDRQLCHIVSSGMFSGVFEIVVHDMTKENAKSYISALRRFYQAGWGELMQIKI